MQFNIYTIPVFTSAFICGMLALYAWRHRKVPAGTEIALILFAIALMSLCSGLEGAAVDRGIKIYWAVLGYLGAQNIPPLFFLAVLRFTQQDRWLTRKWLALLFAFPQVCVIMAATNSFHHLLWSKITLKTTWAGVTGVFSHGPWFWVQVSFGYTLLILGVAMLVRALFAKPRLYSRQAALILTAAVIPWGANLTYVFFPGAVEGLDITAIGFAASGLFLTLAIFRYQLLELGPIARNVLFESMADPTIVTDPEGRLVDLNPPAETLAGKPLDEILGREIEKIFSHHPPLVQFCLGNGEEHEKEIELLVDGEHRYFRALSRQLIRRSRKLGRFIMLHDITNLRVAMEDLKRINAELDVYARTVSHDLKSPLTAISLANDTLMKLINYPRSAETDKNVSKLVEVIDRNTRKAVELIDGLLLLAEAGQKPSRVDSVDVSTVVQKIIEEREAQIKEKGTRFDLDRLDTIIANETQIHQLFSNIIGNCIKHNDSPEPLVEVRLLKSESGIHRYLVRDNGSGFPEEALQSLFVPFFKAGRTGEAGLGLSIAQRIAEVYGGRIRAYNDDGACFEITLRNYLGFTLEPHSPLRREA